LKGCSKKECRKQCRHVKFKSILSKWPIQTQTHRTALALQPFTTKVATFICFIIVFKMECFNNVLRCLSFSFVDLVEKSKCIVDDHNSNTPNNPTTLRLEQMWVYIFNVLYADYKIAAYILFLGQTCHYSRLFRRQGFSLSDVSGSCSWWQWG